jgi:hypothetical protein
VRDLLRNIKPQNISISLYLSLYCRAVVSMNSNLLLVHSIFIFTC